MNYRITIPFIFDEDTVLVKVYKQDEVRLGQTLASEFIAGKEPDCFHIRPLIKGGTFNMLDEPVWERVKIVVQAFIDGMNEREGDSYWVLDM